MLGVPLPVDWHAILIDFFLLLILLFFFKKKKNRNFLLPLWFPRKSKKITGSISKKPDLVSIILFYSSTGFLGKLRVAKRIKKLPLLKIKLRMIAGRIEPKKLQPLLRNSFSPHCLYIVFYVTNWNCIFKTIFESRSILVYFLFLNWTIKRPVMMLKLNCLHCLIICFLDNLKIIIISEAFLRK